jgi:site-specific DNA recombinase
VDRSVLAPDRGELKVDLVGDLAGILTVAVKARTGPAALGDPSLRKSKNCPNGAADVRDLVSQFELVAGARNHLKLLFRAAA